MSKIVCLLIGNIKYDGRVKKEIYSLSEAGHDVSLIVSMHDENDETDYHCKLIHLPRNNGGSFLSKLFRNATYIFRVTKAIKKEKPDFVHCNDLNTLILTFMLPQSIKIVYDSHEIYPETRNGFASRVFFTFAEKYLVYKTCKIIVPQIDRLHYIYFKYKLPLSHYVLLENFPLKAIIPQKNFWERKYGINTKDKFVVSYIGALTKEREVEDIIRAMQYVPVKVVLFIIGPGGNEYEKKLKDVVESLHFEKQVYMFDRISNSEVLEAEASSDIGICIYNAKNLNSYFCASNKVYEYLDYGAKVITTDIGGMSRIIKNGANGHKLKEITSKNIANSINDLITKDENFEANYFWENQVNNYLDIFC